VSYRSRYESNDFRKKYLNELGINVHKCGQSEKQIIAGVPKFQELLNATKDPKLTSCKIFFKKEYLEGNTIQNLRKLVGHNIVELTLGKISKKITICLDKEDEPWYNTFTMIYKDEEWYKDFREHSNCLRIELNLDVLFGYKLPLEKIAEKINKEYADIFCVFSPLHIGILDVFVNVNNIELPEDRVLFITKDNAIEIYLDEVVQVNLEKTIIAGISGVDCVYYTTTDDGEWILETEGTNYMDILCCDIVDPLLTISNNVWEILEILGIEAAREFLIQEFIGIMEGINVCHAKLLVERMTFAGTISSITRYTMKKQQTSIMGRASFEESLDNFQNAAINGDVEFTNNISASIVCGTQGRIGTGITDLKIDVEKLSNFPQVIGQINEESCDDLLQRKRDEYTAKR
jgi:DNA-directed RNA polymerase beta' subunit